MCKVVNELVYFPNDVFVPRTTTLRSSSMLLYYQPFAHTIAFLHSFVSKTCSSWSNLPIYITHAKTLSVLILSHFLLIIYVYHVNSKKSFMFLDMLLLLHLLAFSLHKLQRKK